MHSTVFKTDLKTENEDNARWLLRMSRSVLKVYSLKKNERVVPPLKTTNNACKNNRFHVFTVEPLLLTDIGISWELNDWAVGISAQHQRYISFAQKRENQKEHRLVKCYYWTHARFFRLLTNKSIFSTTPSKLCNTSKVIAFDWFLYGYRCGGNVAGERLP